MKRKIGLVVILILEVAFAVIYYVKSIWNQVISVLPFMDTFAGWIREFLGKIKTWLDIPYFRDCPNTTKNMIIIVVLNLLFVIVYLLVFGIIASIRRRIRRRKIAKMSNRGKFVLSDEEKAKFEWKLYEKHFPIRRLISLIVPILFTFGCVLIRFDRYMCATYDHYNAGYFDLFRDGQTYLGQFGTWLETVFSKYIAVNNRIVDSIHVTWVEWIELGVAFLVLCLIWWGIFSIFARPFRKHHAKKAAKKAKNKYVAKMEYLEYKALKKGAKEMRVSKKNKDLYDNEVYLPETEADVKAIAVATLPSEEKTKSDAQSDEQDYIDDISTGVTDLGVIEEDTGEMQEPLSVRETHFVGDEEIDIELEEEPIIETIEEEEAYYNDTEIGEDTFERYQPGNVSSIDIDDKIKKYNIDVIEEDASVAHFTEDETPTIQEYEDRDILFPNVAEIEENAEDQANSEERAETKEEIDDRSEEKKKDLPERGEKAEIEDVEVRREEKTEKDEAKDKKPLKPLHLPEKEKPSVKPVPVAPMKKALEKKPIVSPRSGKPERPMDVNADRSKVVEYILNTSSGTKLANMEISEEKKAEPLHPVKKEKKDIRPVSPKK